VKTIKVLFMGASRFVGLLERFHEAARALHVKLEVLSLEDDKPWHAIGVVGLTRVIAAPNFREPTFQSFLIDLVRTEGVDVVIPHIDSATIALAHAASALQSAGVHPVSCSIEVCESMADKQRADAVFKSLELPVPQGEQFPLLAKPRFASSSRGIILCSNAEEFDFWRRRNSMKDFVIQRFISGTEYSLDAYVDRSGQTLGIVSRVRVVVAGGEVMVTQTKHHSAAIEIVERLLTWDRWHGPLTVQVIDDGEKAWLIECNPRFGSGTTCSIEAGLNSPEWILRERLGLPVPDQAVQWRNGLCMTRSRADHFLWLS
jgi:carbamoyl-phosphate synthase large subunit